MRRAGKTCYLFQCLRDAQTAGVPKERLVYFNLEDERLATLSADDLGVIIESYYQRFPELRRQHEVHFCFDEIQLVPGWERFIRRLLDSEKVRIYLSGSSAKMLSREVATSMRGRAMETTITPFSFREFLAARAIPPPPLKLTPGARARSLFQKNLNDYIATGGFPEAVAAASAGTNADSLRTQDRDRVRLLQGYVDAVLFRDVAERHAVGNLVALRAFVRQLLRSPAGLLSISKISNDFTSRGVPASKETLFTFLDYLQDAFLVFTFPVHARSERRRQVNPRKLYLADHALAAAFAPAADLDRGHLLENIVACELQRHSRDLAYVRTRGGNEVDFLATGFDGVERLVQVAANVSDPATLARELEALEDARTEHPHAERWLLCESLPPSDASLPPDVHVAPLWHWLGLPRT